MSFLTFILKQKFKKNWVHRTNKQLPKLPKGHFKLIKVGGVCTVPIWQCLCLWQCGQPPTPVELLIRRSTCRKCKPLCWSHASFQGWQMNLEKIKIDTLLERESPRQIAETEQTSTMCEALKDYGKAWGLTVKIRTGHYSDKFCLFLGGEDIYIFSRDSVAVIVNLTNSPSPPR